MDGQVAALTFEQQKELLASQFEQEKLCRNMEREERNMEKKERNMEREETED